jgi:hypothetical protein
MERENSPRVVALQCKWIILKEDIENYPEFVDFIPVGNVK